MKRLMVLIVVLVLMISAAVAVSADPIGVGGLLAASEEIRTFPGKGHPQGGPFMVQVELMGTPIGVGGLE